MAKKKTTPSKAAPDVQLVTGDCVAMRDEALKGRKAQLVFADPPYNQGVLYDGYEDALAFSTYMEWTRGWLRAMREVLDKHGAVWLLYPDELVSWVDVFCQSELKLHKRSHIIWFYTFGVCNQKVKNFSRSHTHALYYTASKSRYTFDGDAVRVPSARLAVYKDKRSCTSGKAPDNTWALLREQFEPYMQPDMDTWLHSRVCGTYREREKESPNQVPLPVMERIIRSTSAVGELVYDPFTGSGTTAVAAVTAGRNFAGTELSPRYAENARERIARAMDGALPPGSLKEA